VEDGGHGGGTPGANECDNATIHVLLAVIVPLEVLSATTIGVRLGTDAGVRRRADAATRPIGYGRAVTLFERANDRIRSADVRIVDGVIAVAFAILAVATVFTQELRDDMVEPTPLALVTILVTTAPISMRRRHPVLAVAVASAGIFWHIAADFPEGTLPISVIFITYSVAAWEVLRRAAIGLAIVLVTIVALGLTGAPGLDALAVVANLAIFGGAWAAGIAVRARRETIASRIREAEERANVERQRAARVLAEERLRIAQELHDVVAHSMSVIAVQAGVGAHVLDEQPEQARAALEAISATSRGALAEMRRLLGVLRDDDGARSHRPAPGLCDLPRLVDDVRSAGVPATLRVSGESDTANPAVELSAYRVIQEALTNVMKHAGATTRVDVDVRRLPGSIELEVVDDGRGAASIAATNGSRSADDGDSGHGLIGMRERVELWGGELVAGPVVGGGYRVLARLPYGEQP
jgi:signal transduction histidine kinase